MSKLQPFEVIALYTTEKLSCREVAARLGASQVAVLKCLRKHSVQLRSKSAAAHARSTTAIQQAPVKFVPIVPLQPIPADRMYKRRLPLSAFTLSDHPVPVAWHDNLAIFVINQDVWDHHSILARNDWSNVDGEHTLSRAVALLPAGSKHLILWKDEYSKPCVQTMIKHRLAEHVSTCSARKCSIQSIEYRTAMDFYNTHHLQGSCCGGDSYGLIFNGALVACMTFNQPGMCRGLPGHHMLQRFATVGSVPGAASRLLAHFRRLHPGPVLSYSDERYAPGGNLYKTLGFIATSTSGPDYRYWRDDRWYAKNSKQKKNLRGEMVTLGLPVDPEDTEQALAAKLGYKRCYDLGKITWLLHS